MSPKILEVKTNYKDSKKKTRKNFKYMHAHVCMCTHTHEQPELFLITKLMHSEIRKKSKNKFEHKIKKHLRSIIGGK